MLIDLIYYIESNEEYIEAIVRNDVDFNTYISQSKECLNNL